MKAFHHHHISIEMDPLTPSIHALLTNMTSEITSSPRRKGNKDSNFSQDSGVALNESWKYRDRVKYPTPDEPQKEYLKGRTPPKLPNHIKSPAKTPTKYCARKEPPRDTTLAWNKGQETEAVGALLVGPLLSNLEADVCEQQLEESFPQRLKAVQEHFSLRKITFPNSVKPPNSVHALIP